MTDQPTPRYVAGVLESADSGKTWQSRAVIRSPQYELCEPSMVQLPEGRLLMVLRPTMTWCESTDGGATWTDVQPLGLQGHAPYLLLTKDNVLLCAFRHPATASTCVTASKDFGRTWGDRVLIDRVLGAYPSLVELADGRILAVYYTEGGGSDIRSVFLRADADGVTVLPKSTSDQGDAE